MTGDPVEPGRGRTTARRRLRRRRLRGWTVLAAALLLPLLVETMACSGSPVAPGPGDSPPDDSPPDPGPPPNEAPVIEAIVIQGRRPRQPANFADLGETVDVAATVSDEETAVDELQYIWTATAGTFQGAGARVRWRAPAEAAAAPGAVTTPAEVTVSLEVVERYGNDQMFEHHVTTRRSLSLHDSKREVGDMARQFLLDFSDSDIQDVDYILRNFDPDCYGTEAERDDVENNRRHYDIDDYDIAEPSVTVNFGGVCPYQARPGDACAQVPVFWRSTRLADGSKEAVRGTDQVAAVYRPDSGQWRLCDSRFDGEAVPGLRGFIR